MRTHLRAALKAALSARDRTAVRALRSALAAIDNAEAVPSNQPATGAHGLGAAEADRRELAEDEILRIVRAEVRDRLSASEEYERLGQTEAAERLRTEAAVLERELPDDR